MGIKDNGIKHCHSTDKTRRFEVKESIHVGLKLIQIIEIQDG